MESADAAGRLRASGGLAHGYYLLEISGAMGSNGLALDGEFQNSRIAGSTLVTQWHDVPSGDGFAGGDYRASFIVADLSHRQWSNRISIREHTCGSI